MVSFNPSAVSTKRLQFGALYVAWFSPRVLIVCGPDARVLNLESGSYSSVSKYPFGQLSNRHSLIILS